MNIGSDWEPRDGGSLERHGPTGDLHRLLPVCSGWRLEHYPSDTIPTPWHIDFFWEAQNPELLLSFSDFLADQAEKDANARMDNKAVIRNDDGYIAIADWRGTNTFTALLAAPDGKTVGSYSGRTNTPMATFVFGQRTIHGNQTMQEAHMGRGLANLLVDAAEQLTGLPAAPHGHMFTPGSCSEAAWRFWTKRAAHKPVPGLTGDDMVRKRHAAALEMESKRLATRIPDNPAAAAAFALATSADIIIAERAGEIGFAWPILNGRRVSRSGLLDDASILRHNLGLWGKWSDPPLSPTEITLSTIDNAEIAELNIPAETENDIDLSILPSQSSAPTVMF
jgi:hypothetical protein